MNGRGARFPRAARLTRAGHFSAVFEARKRVCGRFFCLHWRKKEAGWARVGLVVPRRFARKAVTRNWIKRLAREAFRQWEGRALAIDVVVRLAQPVVDASRRALWADLNALLARLAVAAGQGATVGVTEEER
ncbi:MAG: ribonuclease P protein component [Hydrogenophilus sp.]|nr:ribonuclease P protein component [Hydrogenophilus sp.]